MNIGDRAARAKLDLEAERLASALGRFAAQHANFYGPDNQCMPASEALDLSGALLPILVAVRIVPLYRRVIHSDPPLQVVSDPGGAIGFRVIATGVNLDSAVLHACGGGLIESIDSLTAAREQDGPSIARRIKWLSTRFPHGASQILTDRDGMRQRWTETLYLRELPPRAEVNVEALMDWLTHEHPITADRSALMEAMSGGF